MSEIGHSTLLKFFIDIYKMSEPSGETDSTIKSKVPGEQALRGDYIQELQNVQENNVAVEDDSLSPVITVTKEESTFTKGDLKVQKVIVSEDISDETSNTNRKLIKTETTSPTEVQTEIHGEVSSVTINTEGDTNTSTADQKVVYKVTKIPKLKFKQAVDKVKNEEEMKKEGKDEVELGLKVTETVPRLNDEKNLLQQVSRSESIQQDSPKVEDEFDRIYDEIFENGPPSGNFPSPEKIEDTDKLETKFDEIIHAYDEQKAQANAEKVKSKILLLKRKSEHDIYAPRQTLRKNSLNKRNSIDDTKCKLPVPLTKEKQNVELVSSQKQKTVSAQNLTVFETVNTNISKSVTTASHQKDGERNIMQETEFNSTSEVSKSKIPTHLKNIVAVEKTSDIQTSEISPQFSVEKRNEDIFINTVNKNETHEPETLISEDTIKILNVRDNISNIKTEPLIITDNVEKDPNTNDNNKKDITENIIVEKDTGNRDQITEAETKTHIVTKVDLKNFEPINDSPQNTKALDATNSNNVDKLEKVPNTNDNNKKDITQNIKVEKVTGNKDQITETETKTHIVTKVDLKHFEPINDSPQNGKALDATNSNNVDKLEKVPNTNDNNKKDITQNIIIDKNPSNRDQITETETKTHIVTKVDLKHFEPINDSPQNGKALDATNSNNVDKLEKVPNTNDNNKKDITQNIKVEKVTGNKDQITETETKTHIVTKVDLKHFEPINDSPQNGKALDATNSNNVDKLEKVPNTNDNNKKDITQNIIIDKNPSNRDQITETETKTHIVTKVDLKHFEPINDSPQNGKALDATNSNNVDKLEKVPNTNDNNKKDITQNIIIDKNPSNRDQITETETKTHIVTKVDLKYFEPINDSPQNTKTLDATNSNNVDKLEKVPNTNDNNKKDITQNIKVEKVTGNKDQITETETKTHIVTKVDLKHFEPINDSPQNGKTLDATNSNNVDKLEKVPNTNDNNKKDITQNIKVEKVTGNKDQITETETKTHIVTKVDLKHFEPINDSPQNEKALDATNSNNVDKLGKVPNTNDNNKKDITQNIIIDKNPSNRDQITETETKTHIVTKVDVKNLKPINDLPQNQKPLDATNSKNVDKLEKVPNTNDNNKKDITQNIILEKDTSNRDEITETETKTHIVTKVDLKHFEPINDSPQNGKALDATNSNNVDKLEKVPNTNDNNKKDITQNIIIDKNPSNRDQITETETKTHIVTKVDLKHFEPINDSPQNGKALDATNSNNVDKLEKVPNTNDNNKKDITQNIIIDKNPSNRDQITETETKTHIVTKVDLKNFEPINDSPQNTKTLDATNSNNVDKLEKVPNTNDNNKKDITQNIKVEKVTGNKDQITETETKTHIVTKVDLKHFEPINDSPQNGKTLDATNSNNVDKLEKVPNTNDNNKKDITQNIKVEKVTGNKDQITETETKTHIVTKVDLKHFEPINDSPQNEKALDATNSNNVDKLEKVPNTNDNNKKDITQNIIIDKNPSNRDQITETETKTHIVTKVDVKNLKPINDLPQNQKPLDATNSKNVDKLEKVPNTNDNNKKDITQNIILEKDTSNRDEKAETEAKTHIVTKVDVKNLKPINDFPHNEKPLDATNFNYDFHEKNNHSENNFSKIELQKINVNEINSCVSIKQELRKTVEIVSNSDIKEIQHDQQDKERDNITNIPKDILHISRSDVCLKTNSVDNNSLKEILYDDSKIKLSSENIERNDGFKTQSNASEYLSRSNNEIKSNNLSQEFTINKYPSKSENISQKIITEVNNNEIKTEDIEDEKAIEDNAIRNNKVNSSENNGKDINELEEEDVIILKGKVNRIISRLDSKEYKVNKCELDDLPQEESIVSKIALFEQSKTIDTTKKASNTKNKLADKINIDKPKIVDEVLKIEKDTLPSDSKFSYNTFLNYKKTIKNNISVNENEIQTRSHAKNVSKFDKIFKTNINLNKFDKTSENTVGNSEDEVFFKNEKANRNIINEYKINKEIDLDMRRAKSLAELNYDGVHGRVRQMVVRMNSIDKMALERREQNEVKRKTRHGSVSERIALFEQDANEQSVHLMKKVTPIRMESVSMTTSSSKQEELTPALSEEELAKRITELTQARATYGHYDNMTYVELSDGGRLPSLVVGTALLDPPLVKPIIKAAIDLGYRAIDTAYVYGNEQAIGEAIREKIQDGTVKREELFVLAKLWSTNHRHDLVSRACKQSLDVMGLDYFDLYLIHNPMSFKEGPNPLPKIANVLQYSEHDYLEAWFGIESLIKQGLVKRGGVSNFNSVQVERVLDKGKIKPVVNQVECHPYLSQARLQDYLSSRGVALSCFGCLGSSGTPRALRSSLPPVIHDPLVRTMAAGLGVTPAQLLLSYQLSLGRSVVVKASSAAHLWDDLRSLDLRLAPAHAAGLVALNRNKRTFTFEGMGDTHKNYPFKIPF